MMRIDAHQHFWDLGLPWTTWPTADVPAIHRSFGPGDLLPILEEAGVSATVLVQSQPCAEDTEWMLKLAERTAFVAGVVGWCDLTSPHARQDVETLALRSKVVGLRPMLQDLADAWILDPAIAPALRAMDACGLVFDALIRPRHMAAITILAERYPTLRIVVDHAGKPPIAQGAFEPWASSLARLARRPNVHVKLSGIVTEAGAVWSEASIARYVEHLIDCFGADRVLWGSDWPVVLCCAEYLDWLGAAETLIPAADRAKVFGETAVAVYGLD